MRHTLYFLFLILLATACSKPVANFLIEPGSSYPKEFVFKNESSGAEKYQWKLNGVVVSEETHYNQSFISSGRYDIELIAHSGTKKSSHQEAIFIEAPVECLVYLKTTYGDLILSLSENTLDHQTNFINLVNSGFYNGMKFHRVMNGFMIQVGDPKMRKEKFKGESPQEIPAEINNTNYHIKGALAAARMPDNINPNKNSSGTQFYIVHGRNVDEDNLIDNASSKLIDYSESQIQDYLARGGAPQLDTEYTVFGQLLVGFETLDRIANVATDERDMPIEDVYIIESKIVD